MALARGLRQRLALLLIAVLFALPGCGQSGGPPPSPDPPSAAASPALPEEEASAGHGGGEAAALEQSSSQNSREESFADPDSTIESTQGAQSGSSGAAPAKEARSYVLSAYAAGNEVIGNEHVDLDVSNTSEGYVCIRYNGGGSSKIKVLIVKSGNTYQYDLNSSGRYEVFPFTEGDGSYTVGVYQNVRGNEYATLYSTSVQVSLRSPTLPFLYPNQYVNFWEGSAAVTAGAELARTAQSDLDIVSAVYNYTLEHITYDYDKAAAASAGQMAGYLPQADSILASGKGICFDYAAVMTVMLRTQGIPTKLVVGYAGSIYHAWVSIYITDVGWVNGAVYFDGSSWTRMDPTFADNDNQSEAIMAFINNPANYTPLYYY